MQTYVLTLWFLNYVISIIVIIWACDWLSFLMITKRETFTKGWYDGTMGEKRKCTET